MGIVLGLVVLLLVGLAIVRKRMVPKPALPPEISLMKNCDEVGGDVCEIGEECPGEWLTVSDSLYCCSKTCILEQPLEVLPFDLEIEPVEIGEIL